MTKPEDKALAFAHSFLGIRLQCAQCHKHPFAPWTQADFQQFSAFFKNVEFGVSPDAANEYRQLAGKVGLSGTGNQGSAIRPDVLRHAQDGGVIPWRELYIAKGSGPASLSLLRSGIVELKPDEDPRAAIMNWMKQPNNWPRKWIGRGRGKYGRKLRCFIANSHRGTSCLDYFCLTGLPHRAREQDQ